MADQDWQVDSEAPIYSGAPAPPAASGWEVASEAPVAAQGAQDWEVAGEAPLSPAAPGQVEPGNIDLNNRPIVNNPDGSFSTVRSISVNVDGKEVLLPTVSDDGRILSTAQAIDLYKRTGKHLGKFADAASADAYAQQLHQQQAAQYGPAAAGLSVDVSRVAKPEDRAAVRQAALESGGLSADIRPPQLLAAAAASLPVSPETADVVQSPASGQAVTGPAPERLPEAALADLASGNGKPLTPAEYAHVLDAASRGALRDPAGAVQLLALHASPQAAGALQHVVEVRQAVDHLKAKAPDPDVVDTGQLFADTTNSLAGAAGVRGQPVSAQDVDAFMDAAVRSGTLGYADPTAPPPLTDQQVLSGKGLPVQLEAQSQARREQDESHPVATAAGELIGVTLPYLGAVKALRGIGMLHALERGTAGAVGEGAAGGFVVGAASKPGDESDITLSQDLQARAKNGVASALLGAAFDAGATTLGTFGRFTLDKLHEAGNARALAAEAKARGFDTPEEYVASLVDLVKTPDGKVIVQPKVGALDDLPDAAGRPAAGKAEAPQTWEVASEQPMSSAAAEPAESAAAEPGQGAQPAPPEFLDPHEQRLADHNAAASAVGVTPEQAAALAPQDAREPVTGFFRTEDRLPTLRRSMAYAEQTGVPVVYTEADLANLGAFNPRFGASQVNARVYAPISAFYRQELEATGGKVIPFKHGGDEFSAIVVGAKPADVALALQRAKAQAQSYSDANFPDVASVKRPGTYGTGLSVGMAEVVPGRPMDAILNTADTAVEADKLGVAHVDGRTPAEAGTLAPEGRPGTAQGGAVEAAATAPRGRAGAETGQPQQAKVSYFDPRLNRETYRYELQHRADDLTQNSGGELVGGDFSPLNAELSRDKESEVRRLPSINPDWFQRINGQPDTAMAVKKVKASVRKALAGEKLGTREQRVVQAMLDSMTAERVMPGNIKEAMAKLQGARELRELARQGVPRVQLHQVPLEVYAEDAEHVPGFHFSEDEYDPRMDGAGRTLFELGDEAMQIDPDRVETVLEDAARGAKTRVQAAQELWGIIQERGTAHETAHTKPGAGDREGSAGLVRPGAAEGEQGQAAPSGEAQGSQLTQGALPGIEPRNDTAQGLQDRQREIDARLRGEHVAAGAGPGDLFSGRSRQTEIPEDSGNEIQEPSGDSYSSRRDDTGGPQLLLPLGASQEERAAAVAAFGKRSRHVEVATLPTGLTRVNSAADVAHVAASIRKDSQETFLAVVTDDQGKVLRVARLHRGTLDSASVDPALLVATAANTPGAKKLWTVHNHPSGTVAQSDADFRMAGKVRELLRGTGVDLAGSITVGHGSPFYEVDGRQPGAQTGHVTAAARTKSVPLTERRLVGPSTSAASMRDTAAVAREFERVAPGQEGVLFTDSRLRPVGFLPMTAEEMRELRTGAGGGAARLFRALDDTNAVGMFARTSSDAAAANIRAFGDQAQRQVHDVLDMEGKSRTESDRLGGQSTFYANPFLVGAGELARDIGLNPGRQLAAAFTGATVSAITTKEKPGSAAWWIRVAEGAGAGLTVSWFLRGAKLTGEGSITSGWMHSLGEAIEHLPLIGRGPGDLRDLQRRQKLMRQVVDRQVGVTGEFLLKHFTPSERGQMADLIEGRGIVKDFNMIHRQAQALEDYITAAAERMKALNMLPADLETGGYLHRYYAKHLGLLATGPERAALKQQGLAGSYTLARGSDDIFDADHLSGGTRKVLDEMDSVNAEIRKLSGKRPDLLSDDTAERLQELHARRRELGKVEFREYLAGTGKSAESYIFADDEVPRVSKLEPMDGSALHAGVSYGGGRIIENETGDVATADVPASHRTLEPGDLAPTDRRWKLRGTVEEGKVQLHRDWTKAERQSWGEITDAGYRFVRGMSEVSHDLSLATLFNTVAKRKDWVSETPRVAGGGSKLQQFLGKEWVKVPDGNAGKGTPMKKYGALAGKYVRPDIWAHMRGFSHTPFSSNAWGKAYNTLLQKWKLWKTVYNPVTHFNNTWSNTETLLMSGYSPSTLAGAFHEIRKGEGSVAWREARDAGLFGNDWASTLVKEGGKDGGLAAVAEAMRQQPEIPDADVVHSAMMRAKEWWIQSRNAVDDAGSPWKTGVELARAAADPVSGAFKAVKSPFDYAGKSAQRLYSFEENVFKMAVYQAERAKGVKAEAAVKTANGLFFDYGDVPEAIKWIRALPIGAPFVSYTYHAIPMIARNLVQKPEYMLALAAAYEAVNYAGTMTDSEMGPGEYWALSSADDDLSSPWDKGRAIWGARNTVRLPYLDGYKLALGRAHALGNPFASDAGNRTLGLPGALSFWGADIFGSNPLHALLDVAINEDWKGKPIYKAGAPESEQVHNVASYLYQAWAPSNPLTPGGYSQDKILEGMANRVATDKAAGRKPPVIINGVVQAANAVSQALGFETYTGKDRGGTPIMTRDAILASLGVKWRPADYEQQLVLEFGATAQGRAAAADWFKGKSRDFAAGRIPKDTYKKETAQFQEDLKEMGAQDKRHFDSAAFLRKRDVKLPPE